MSRKRRGPTPRRARASKSTHWLKASLGGLVLAAITVVIGVVRDHDHVATSGVAATWLFLMATFAAGWRLGARPFGLTRRMTPRERYVTLPIVLLQFMATVALVAGSYVIVR